MASTTAAPATSSTSSAAAPPAANAPFASASLYVGDLADDINEAFLYELFSGIGPVASVRVCRDASTRRSLGYAYVNFHRAEDAERALDSLNFKPIRGSPLRIMWSIRDPTLRRSGAGNIFIRGLDKSIDNKLLWDTFSIFGNILSCKVVCNNKGESLGYGFVHFADEEVANAAIEKVNGKMVGTSIVSVQQFKSKKDRGVSTNTTFTNVFVKNLSPDTTKEQLDGLFSKYGTITSSVITVSPAKDLAFGFVNYQTHEQALASIEGLNNFEFQSKKLYVGRAQTKEEREREVRERSEQIRQERFKKYTGVNLYVKNISESFDDAKLLQEFSKFGTISSAKIMRDERGNSRGFGFVCFSSPEEATRAVTEMHNSMLDNKPLYVALHQRKEQRRAFMEAQRGSQPRFGGPMVPPMYPYNMMFPQQRGFQPVVFPQMNNNRYPPNRPGQFQQYGNPNMRGAQPQYPNFQLMPIQQRMNGMNQRGPRNNRGPRINGPNAGPAQPKYGENVRNRPAQQNVQAAPATAQEPKAAATASGQLTVQQLTSLSPAEQKQQIGERLYRLISAKESELAGKITGMLLELDNFELLHLLESQEALNEKIQEAIVVLNTAENQE